MAWAQRHAMQAWVRRYVLRCMQERCMPPDAAASNVAQAVQRKTGATQAAARGLVLTSFRVCLDLLLHKLVLRQVAVAKIELHLRGSKQGHLRSMLRYMARRLCCSSRWQRSFGSRGQGVAPDLPGVQPPARGGTAPLCRPPAPVSEFSALFHHRTPALLPPWCCTGPCASVCARARRIRGYFEQKCSGVQVIKHK